jgi:hypothetical protein
VIFEVLVAAYLEITFFWDVAQCSLLKEYSTMKMETAGSSETLLSADQTALASHGTDISLCVVRSDTHQEGLSQDGSGSNIRSWHV